ncbi:MAG: hypothetical protein EXS32_13020 [Opitutus sp.]|nr:hypothetical protein [Opitutus sp.]
MRRVAKVKVAVARVPLRKAAMTSAAASRRSFPAWIDAGERGVAFFATTAVPRVRDALVLRIVGRKKSAATRNFSDGDRVR